MYNLHANTVPFIGIECVDSGIWWKSYCSCPAAMDELGYLKGRLEMKKDGVQEKNEAKTKVSDQGSKFNSQHCLYIEGVLCFS